MTTRFVQCRYIRRNGEQCTAEAMDTSVDSLIIICSKHAAAVLLMTREAAAKKKGTTR